MIRQNVEHAFTPANSIYLITSACVGASALAVKGVRKALSKPSIQRPRKYDSVKVSRTYLEKRRLDPS